MLKDEASDKAHGRLALIQRQIQLNLRDQRRVLDELERLLFLPEKQQKASWSKNPIIYAEAGVGSQMDSHGRFATIGGDGLANNLLNSNAHLLVLLASYNSLVTAYAEEHFKKKADKG